MRFLTVAMVSVLLIGTWVAWRGVAMQPPQEAVVSATAEQRLSLLAVRVTALEEAQQEVLQRLRKIEEMRARELRVLLALHEDELELSGENGGAALQLAADGEGADASGDDPSGEEAPSLEQHLIDTGKRLIEEDEFDTALEVLSLALESNPNSDEAHFHRGVALHLKDLYQEAIHEFQEAITTTENPRVRYISLYNQACGFALLGEVTQSVELLEKSFEEGYQDIVMQMATDSDLNNVRDNQRFQDFLLQLRTP
jgi:tetratricopeptide (TPR) repeat protein